MTPQAGIAGPVPKHAPLLIEALQRSGCAVVTRPWSRRGEGESPSRKVMERTKDLLGILRLTWKLRPDVLLVKTSHDARAMLRDVPLAVSMRLMRCPCVLQFHGSLPNLLVGRGRRFFKLCSRMLVRMSGTVLLLSSEECRLWRAFDSRPRYVLVCNPFDPRRAAALSRSDPADQSVESPPVVLFAGRLLREKGVVDLVRALPGVLKSTEVVLTLAGDGPDRAACLEAAERIGVVEHVHLPGYLQGDVLDAAYRDAAVFAFPSYWPEGFPTVLSEAMAAGLPIVTTATRGAADHLQEPENALFVPPRDSVALAAAIVRILSDRDLAGKMTCANQAKVRKFFPDAVVGPYLDALKHAVGDRSPG